MDAHALRFQPAHANHPRSRRLRLVLEADAAVGGCGGAVVAGPRQVTSIWGSTFLLQVTPAWRSGDAGYRSQR